MCSHLNAFGTLVRALAPSLARPIIRSLEYPAVPASALPLLPSQPRPRRVQRVITLETRLVLWHGTMQLIFWTQKKKTVRLGEI